MRIQNNERNISIVLENEDVIYRSVKDAILNRKLRPNTQLIEDALAESFGVSRTPVRQALRRLSYEKLVKLIPHKGAFVNCPTVEEAKKIEEIRLIIEAAAVRIACRIITEEQIKQMALMIKEEEAAHLAGDKFESLRLSLNFHLKIGEVTGNEYLHRYLEELTSLVYMIVTFYGNDKTFCGCGEHIKLLNLIAEGKEDLAEAFMVEHLQEVSTGINYDESFTTSLTDIFK